MLQVAKKKPTKLTDQGKQLLPRALISNVIVFCDKERIKQASNETVAKNFWKYLLSNSDRYIYIRGLNLKSVKQCSIHKVERVYVWLTEENK